MVTREASGREPVTGRAERRSPPRGTGRLLVGGLAVAAGAGSLAVQAMVVPSLSGNLDEGVYLFQAEMLLDGRLSLPADRHGTFFRPWLSGERDGRIFTEYQVGFPTLLAAAERGLGSARAGLAAIAAWNVVAVHGLSRALWQDRRTAVWAALLVAASPMLVLHSALFLTYVATLAALASAGWAALVAVDRRSAPLMALAGALVGVGVLIRPLDALLAGVPLAALVVVRARQGAVTWPQLGRWSAVVALAAVPALVATALYNARTTGAPLEFPNMAADPLNRFGFGVRRLVESEPVVEYRTSHALGALRRNLQAVPSWSVGGALLLPLAGWGALRSGRRPERLVIVALGLAFPLAYFFWWATRLSALDVTNGIGPHYYVPSFLALGLLGARGVVGVVDALERRVPAAVAAGVVALVLAVGTWPSIPDKLDEQRRVTEVHHAADRAIPDDLRDAVVVVEYGRPYLMSSLPFLVGDPALEADVLYAVDRGARNAELVELFPDRAVLRLRDDGGPADERFALVCELPATC